MKARVVVAVLCMAMGASVANPAATPQSIGLDYRELSGELRSWTKEHSFIPQLKEYVINLESYSYPDCKAQQQTACNSVHKLLNRLNNVHDQPIKVEQARAEAAVALLEYATKVAEAIYTATKIQYERARAAHRAAEATYYYTWTKAAADLVQVGGARNAAADAARDSAKTACDTARNEATDAQSKTNQLDAKTCADNAHAQSRVASEACNNTVFDHVRNHIGLFNRTEVVATKSDTDATFNTLDTKDSEQKNAQSFVKNMQDLMSSAKCVLTEANSTYNIFTNYYASYEDKREVYRRKINTIVQNVKQNIDKLGGCEGYDTIKPTEHKATVSALKGIIGIVQTIESLCSRDTRFSLGGQVSSAWHREKARRSARPRKWLSPDERRGLRRMRESAAGALSGTIVFDGLCSQETIGDLRNLAIPEAMGAAEMFRNAMPVAILCSVLGVPEPVSILVGYGGAFAGDLLFSSERSHIVHSLYCEGGCAYTAANYLWLAGRGLWHIAPPLIMSYLPYSIGINYTVLAVCAIAADLHAGYSGGLSFLYGFAASAASLAKSGGDRISAGLGACVTTATNAIESPFKSIYNWCTNKSQQAPQDAQCPTSQSWYKKCVEWCGAPTTLLGWVDALSASSALDTVFVLSQVFAPQVLSAYIPYISLATALLIDLASIKPGVMEWLAQPKSWRRPIHLDTPVRRFLFPVLPMLYALANYRASHGGTGMLKIMQVVPFVTAVVRSFLANNQAQNATQSAATANPVAGGGAGSHTPRSGNDITAGSYNSSTKIRLTPFSADMLSSKAGCAWSCGVVGAVLSAIFIGAQFALALDINLMIPGGCIAVCALLSAAGWVNIDDKPKKAVA
jgi:hypothetical protein